MTETIKNEFVLEGIEIGKTEAKVNDILTLLQIRFGKTPKDVSDGLRGRTDLVALQSLFILAAQCEKFEEFQNALK